jgi:hypothetical protein
MKKQFFIITLFIVISACSTVKKLPATVAGASRARFVGSWTLTMVSYDGLLSGSVQTLFNQDAPANFKGSIWKLTNSGNGSFTLVNADPQSIFWSYNKDNGEIFQFKKLYQGDSARKVQTGYQLIVESIDDSHMVLKSPVALGDKTAYVVLHFEKLP